MEHLEIVGRGEHGFVFSSFEDLLLIMAIDLIFVFVADAVEKDFGLAFVVDFVLFLPISWIARGVLLCS